jgi:cysteine synthase A
MNVHQSTLQTIGSTPVVKLNQIVPPGSAEVYVKLEFFNPTGSYKDRMALAMIEEAEKRGDLRPGMSVVEYTGGSTGSSLAFVCAMKGYPLKLVSSDAFSAEKLSTMRAFGADLTIVPSDHGEIKQQLFIDMVETARALAAEPGTYWTDQFNNRDSIEGYKNIGRELAVQFENNIDVFCAAVGTAGMLIGVSQALKEAAMSTSIVALEPASSPVLSQCKQGSHRV